jgi:hypothetical protein
MFASNLDDMKTTLVQDTAAVLSAVRAMATQEAFLDLELKCADGEAVKANATLLCACSPTIAHLFLHGERSVDVRSQTLAKIVSLVSAGSVQLQCTDERREVLEAAKRLQIRGVDMEDETEIEVVQDESAEETTSNHDFVRRVENWRCVSQADTEPTVDEDWTDSLKDFDDEDDAERVHEEGEGESAETSDEQQSDENTAEIEEMAAEDEAAMTTQRVVTTCVEDVMKPNEKTQEIVETRSENDVTMAVTLFPGEHDGEQLLNEKTREVVEMTTEDEMAVATQLVTQITCEKGITGAVKQYSSS